MIVYKYLNISYGPRFQTFAARETGFPIHTRTRLLRFHFCKISRLEWRKLRIARITCQRLQVTCARGAVVISLSASIEDESMRSAQMSNSRCECSFDLKE